MRWAANGGADRLAQPPIGEIAVLGVASAGQRVHVKPGDSVDRHAQRGGKIRIGWFGRVGLDRLRPPQQRDRVDRGFGRLGALGACQDRAAVRRQALRNGERPDGGGH
jgi:hypothetical protein